jgi:mRNA-degrading endonuclease HigB of HigAB toxin-antitoxin module
MTICEKIKFETKSEKIKRIFLDIKFFFKDNLLIINEKNNANIAFVKYRFCYIYTQKIAKF